METTAAPLLPLILGILVSLYLLDTIADLLNVKTLKSKIPSEFAGIYDPVQYDKALHYLRENSTFTLTRSTVSLLILVPFIVLGGFNQVDRFARSTANLMGLDGIGIGEIGAGLLFGAILSGLRFLLALPFSIYDTFVIEEKFGFNRTTPKVFVLDIVKGTLLGAVIGGLVFAGIMFFFQKMGSYAWLYAWGAVTVFSLFLGYLAPVIFLPLFNRFEPLPTGPLKEAIEDYARKQNFVLSGIFTMDSSKRSSKSNAFFTGFGRFRKLVLFDTLIEKHTPEELVAVVAHEVGHFKCRHIIQFMLISIFTTFLLFFMLSLLMQNRALFDAFKMEQVSIYASLIFAAFLYAPVGRVVSLGTNALSRRFEFEADRYSARTFGKPAELISALKKLSRDNLSYLTPHPFKVTLEYTHPPVLQRVQALKNFK